MGLLPDEKNLHVGADDGNLNHKPEKNPWKSSIVDVAKFG